MLAVENSFQIPDEELLVSFDLEWTKNYRISNGNKPFCFSFVCLPACINLLNVEKELRFGLVLRYVEDEDEIPHLIEAADQILGDFMKKKPVVVGHQLSSDMSVLIRHRADSYPQNFVLLRKTWRNRKDRDSEHNTLTTFDTRYDMEPFLVGKSRRLVDVCAECNLVVSQPEIRSSMTKMQKDFYLTQDKEILERLCILNIRHSLSAALLYFLYEENYKPKRAINVNRVIYNNLQDHFDYVRGKQFRELLF